MSNSRQNLTNHSQAWHAVEHRIQRRRQDRVIADQQEISSSGFGDESLLIEQQRQDARVGAVHFILSEPPMQPAPVLDPRIDATLGNGPDLRRG